MLLICKVAGEAMAHPTSKATSAWPSSQRGRDSLPWAGPETLSVDSQSLLGQRSELTIRHRDETYRLRETRLGKLILTK
ncbi:MAG TPA: hemin uptake protein HemP [Rhodocyclaceae bacterium]